MSPEDRYRDRHSAATSTGINEYGEADAVDAGLLARAEYRVPNPPTVTTGQVGAATARLFSLPAAVEFATDWMVNNRRNGA